MAFIITNPSVMSWNIILQIQPLTKSNGISPGCWMFFPLGNNRKEPQCTIHCGSFSADKKLLHSFRNTISNQLRISRVPLKVTFLNQAAFWSFSPNQIVNHLETDFTANSIFYNFPMNVFLYALYLFGYSYILKIMK